MKTGGGGTPKQRAQDNANYSLASSETAPVNEALEKLLVVASAEDSLDERELASLRKVGWGEGMGCLRAAVWGLA